MLAVAKDDRHLAHGEPARQGALGKVDLEAVAVRADRVQLDRLEHLAPKALEAAREIANLEVEHAPCVRPPAATDHPSQRTPVLDAAAGHVARAEREIGARVDG